MKYDPYDDKIVYTVIEKEKEFHLLKVRLEDDLFLWFELN